MRQRHPQRSSLLAGRLEGSFPEKVASESASKQCAGFDASEEGGTGTGKGSVWQVQSIREV